MAVFQKVNEGADKKYDWLASVTVPRRKNRIRKMLQFLNRTFLLFCGRLGS